MGKLTRAHLIETAIWLTIFVIFFAFTFEFNQPIEIYKFGATGWPRTVLGLLLVILMGNLFYCYKHGSALQSGRVGVGDEDEPEHKGWQSKLNILAILGVPFIFAILLKPVGFYFSAPFFIAMIILIFGERRPLWIAGITLFIYGLLLALFLVVLNAPLPQGNLSPFYDYSAFILRMNNNLQQLELW